MREVIRLDPKHVRAARDDVLERLGLEATDTVSPRLADLIERASKRLVRTAVPVALVETVDREEFGRIYAGDGANAPRAPLDEIYSRADALALFAATLGPAIDDVIRHLFQSGDPALGYVLDVTASSVADRLADLTGRRFLAHLERARTSAAARVLPYSPGYCGWHVSGQAALFERLRPQQIGITLTKGCLMEPIKSVSGVLVAGRGDVHKFRPTYPFCDACTTHDCRVRMASVLTPGR